MKKERNSATKREAVTILVSVVLVVLISISSVLIYTAHKNDDHVARLSLALTEQKYALDKLSFCVNNDISPCDDSTISTWNESHEDTTFELKAYNQLVEESIKERALIK